MPFSSKHHTHAATLISGGVLDPDVMPLATASERGAVPATGAPSNKFLRDDLSWQSAGAGTPSGSVESEITWGISPNVGVSADYSRGDHMHGTPAAFLSGLSKITVGIVEPVAPSVGDLWIDTN